MRSPKHIQEAARTLRKEATLAEKLLWTRLRGRALGGFKFRRQHPMGRFVLDFYCAEARLAVELDGSQHREPSHVQRDHLRTERLGHAQVVVLRIQNDDVLQQLDQVCDHICSTLNSLSHPMTERRSLDPVRDNTRSLPNSLSHPVGEGRGEGERKPPHRRAPA